MNKALNCAVGLLARREHSVWELKRKLHQKGYSEQESTHAVHECLHRGYQSDERFAEQLCRARIEQGYGPLRIRQELAAKGVGDDLIERLFVEDDDAIWQERAMHVLKKKCRTLLAVDSPHLMRTCDIAWNERQKLQRFLLYRGFSSSLIAHLFDVL